MTVTSNHVLFASLVVLARLIAGCGGNNARPNCDASEQANLTIRATDRANPDEDGRPLPTVIRVYQLANIGTMETATFEEIWESDEDTLGEAFLGKDELTIYPDTTVNREFERNPDANYIVGAAIVRRPTGQSWRTILEIPPPASEAQCAALQENPEEPAAGAAHRAPRLRAGRLPDRGLGRRPVSPAAVRRERPDLRRGAGRLRRRRGRGGPRGARDSGGSDPRHAQHPGHPQRTHAVGRAVGRAAWEVVNRGLTRYTVDPPDDRMHEAMTR